MAEYAPPVDYINIGPCTEDRHLCDPCSFEESPGEAWDRGLREGRASEWQRIRQRATECETCGEVHLGYLLPGADGHLYKPRFCSPDSTLMERLADLLDGDDDA